MILDCDARSPDGRTQIISIEQLESLNTADGQDGNAASGWTEQYTDGGGGMGSAPYGVSMHSGVLCVCGVS